MKIHYLEVVTPDVALACETYSLLHSVQFSAADPSLGGARTATLANGGKLGIRAPLRDTELPIVRHYILVEDIQATVDAAQESGAEVAVPPMELPGHGQCAIVIQAGIELGFWQL
ncbi:VOC family protein [Vibrio superstes]|uniref:Hydroxylase n=1 Tax=Vibrio superstes NBRC 103154 TaxID=1219062 RepID=A0A511QKI4_9VIBR|nr:hydroxylase [Vibrio superstes]GEM77809.1 hypothetical protein VSU01S_00540 [Vibrio superstes NBRC 103154]